MAPSQLHSLSLIDIETMSSQELFDEIKYAINVNRDGQKSLAEDAVRILKFKRGLLLADPENATESLADQGIKHESTREWMDNILASFSDSTSDACTQIKEAVEKYLDVEEPEDKFEKLDNNAQVVCELASVRLRKFDTH